MKYIRCQAFPQCQDYLLAICIFLYSLIITAKNTIPNRAYKTPAIWKQFINDPRIGNNLYSIKTKFLKKFVGLRAHIRESIPKLYGILNKLIISANVCTAITGTAFLNTCDKNIVKRPQRIAMSIASEHVRLTTPTGKPVGFLLPSLACSRTSFSDFGIQV